MIRAKFSYQVVNGVLCIIDEYNDSTPTMTVTNDVENVLQEIYNQHPEYKQEVRKVVYCDSYGEWDEIIVNGDGEFLKFWHLEAFNMEEAIKNVLPENK